MGRSGDREMGRWGDREMGRSGDGEIGRWGDREMREIFIKGNCHKMILGRCRVGSGYQQDCEVLNWY
ncbi:hypothetical protein [Moorena producens]|uniref:hypothetical protein n=1 Tax=Moorena producens TaxID=1155739 RepID=UPI003C777556